MRRRARPPFWIDPESDLPDTGRFGWLPWMMLAVMIVAFAACFVWLSLARHAAFQSHAFDLGNMDQAVWNTLHGRFLWFTDMEVGHRVYTTRLAIHVEPLLVLLAPLYVFHGGPETLLTVQAIVVAAGAIPAYLLGRGVLGRPYLALAFPLAYLLHPSVQNAVLDDFHAVTLGACFLLWALYFAWRGSALGFAISAVLAAATKEEIGLLVATLGVLFLYRRRWYVGAMAVMCGIAWFTVCVGIVIPAANPAGHSPYLARYANLGHGLLGVVGGAVRHPRLVWDTLTSAGRTAYLLDLLHPLGFVSIAGVGVFLLCLPSLLINMLSNDPSMYSGYYQYSAEIVPFVVGSAAVGTGMMAHAAARWGRGARAIPAACLLVLVASAVDCWRYGFTPLSSGYIVPSSGPHQKLEWDALQMVPAGAVVSAADEIEPHISDRHWAYMLPTVNPRNGPAARYIVLDASIPSLPVSPRVLRRAAQTALAGGYGVRYANDGILLLRKGTSDTTLPPAFYSFVFRPSRNATQSNAHWGALRLRSFTVHPRNGSVNRSRPAVSIDTYWETRRRLPPGMHIAFFLSPVYKGNHPRISAAWRADTDSPTWDWLPLSRWPRGKTISASSLPLLPPPNVSGKVDVAVGVFGGPKLAAGTTGRLSSHVVRVATISVDG